MPVDLHTHAWTHTHTQRLIELRGVYGGWFDESFLMFDLERFPCLRTSRSHVFTTLLRPVSVGRRNGQWRCSNRRDAERRRCTIGCYIWLIYPTNTLFSLWKGSWSDGWWRFVCKHSLCVFIIAVMRCLTWAYCGRIVLNRLWKLQWNLPPWFTEWLMEFLRHQITLIVS